MTRLYGRALSNERVNEYVPDVRFERTTVLSAIRVNGKQESLIFKGALTGDFFKDYVDKILSPKVKKGDIIILDNLSVHKVLGAFDSVYKKGATVIFLPPYSPDLNPIELCWSKMKSVIRKIKPRVYEDLVFAMKLAIESIAKSNAINWFKHCGYVCQ